MAKRDKDAKKFRDEQGARVSRWLRDSEAGNLFYGSDGECYHLLEDEADELERFAKQWIERGATNDFAPIPYRPLKVAAFVLLALTYVAGLTSSALVVLCLCAFLVACLLYGYSIIENGARYEAGLQRWRDETTAKLAGLNRGGVPKHIATRARRHNVFNWVINALIAVVFVICLVVGPTAVTISEQAERIAFGVMMACTAAVPALNWAAKRVDSTHRRRKWLD